MKVRIRQSYDNGGVVRDKPGMPKDPNSPIFNEDPNLTRKVKIVAPGGSATQLSSNPYSSPIFKFNGPSHEEGGIPIAYKGKQVEVEGDETAYVDKQGDLNVFGNLYIPGTKTKFKKAGKDLAKKEEKANNRFSYAQRVMDQVIDEDNKWDRLKMNAGSVMTNAALNQLEAITNSKEDLANLQNKMLENAEALNVPPNYLYGKARKGVSVPSDEFGIFRPPSRYLPPTSNELPSFVPNYVNTEPPIDVPMDRLGYDLQTVRIKEPKQPKVSSRLNNPVPKSVQASGYTPGTREYFPSLTTPTYSEPLSFAQVLPELFTLATNKRETVPGFNFQPQLYSPYKVSFRDRQNENNATFRSVARQVGNNPAALAQLAAGKYQADTGVLGEEFRTNQAIQNQVTNQNTELINASRQMNIQLAQQQNMAQAQNAAATRATTREALKSLAAKQIQQRRSNREMTMLNQLFPNYRYNPETQQIEFAGGNAQITVNGVPAYSPNIAQAYGQVVDKDYIRNERGKIIQTQQRVTPGFMKVFSNIFKGR